MITLNPGKDKGFATLLAVLVVGTIASSIALASVLFGLSAARTNLALDQENQAKALANACAEEALMKIVADKKFSGPGQVVFGSNTCTYLVLAFAKENRTIQSVGTVGSVVRKVQITLDQIKPQINLTSWQEQDF